jgi:hypothetical protein
MNKWVKRFGILAVLGYCGIMLIVGGSLAFILGIIGIVGVAGLYARASMNIQNEF